MPLEQQLGTYILIYKQEVTKRKLTGNGLHGLWNLKAHPLTPLNPSQTDSATGDQDANI